VLADLAGAGGGLTPPVDSEAVPKCIWITKHVMRPLHGAGLLTGGSGANAANPGIRVARFSMSGRVLRYRAPFVATDPG